VERRVRTLGDSHNPEDPTFAGLRAKALAEHRVKEIEDLPFNYNGLVMAESEKLTAAAYREHMAGLLGIYQQQGTVVGLAGFLSPYVAMRTLSTALAGVDLPHLFEFERQAEDYRYALIQHLNELHTNEVALALDRYTGVGENGAPTRQRIGREHWQSVPVASFSTPTVGWALAQQPLGAAGVLVWAVLVMTAVALAPRRCVAP
jgi:ABC-2 type transport system permease protein